jgi:hypothetical protein
MATDPNGIIDSAYGDSAFSENTEADDSNDKGELANEQHDDTKGDGDTVENPVTTPEIEPGHIPGVDPENTPITEPEIAPGKIPDDSLIPHK